jgi:hypothetical protein
VKFGAELLLARDVVALEAHGPKRVLRLDDGRGIAAHAVVLATGVSYRSMGVDGVDDLTGRGVYYGSAMTEAAECADRDVYIVGGANSAGQAAVFFSRYARSVCLLVRGTSLEASMSAYLVEQIAGIGSISVRTCTTVAGAQGDGHLEAITVEDARTGERRRCRPVTCSSSSAARRAPAGSTARSSATSAGSSPPARRCCARAPSRRLGPGPRPVPAGDQPARGVRRRGRARRLGEAGRLGRRRGRDGGHAVHRYLEER